MKRLILALALLTALPALAGSYTVTTNAKQDTRLERWRVRLNRTTCQYYSLPGSCTQTQARKAFCVRAGFGEITSCDGANQVVVYADIQTMLNDQISTLFDGWKAQLASDDAAALAAAQAAASQAQKDQACAALGLAAGCM